MYSTVINILANLSEIQPSRFDVDITTLGDNDDRRGKNISGFSAESFQLMKN